MVPGRERCNGAGVGEGAGGVRKSSWAEEDEAGGRRPARTLPRRALAGPPKRGLRPPTMRFVQPAFFVRVRPSGAAFGPQDHQKLIRGAKPSLGEGSRPLGPRTKRKNISADVWGRGSGIKVLACLGSFRPSRGLGRPPGGPGASRLPLVPPCFLPPCPQCPPPQYLLIYRRMGGKAPPRCSSSSSCSLPSPRVPGWRELSVGHGWRAGPWRSTTRRNASRGSRDRERETGLPGARRPEGDCSPYPKMGLLLLLRLRRLLALLLLPPHPHHHSYSLITLRLPHTQTQTHSYSDTRTHSDSESLPVRPLRLTHTQTHSHSDSLTLRLTHTQTSYSDPHTLRLTHTKECEYVSGEELVSALHFRIVLRVMRGFPV